jgi:chaperone BCS1
MTTNDMTSLDPALIRPGRIDLTFRFRRATSAQASQLFKLFYEDWAPDTDYATTSTVEPTSAENRGVIAGLAEKWSAMVEDDAYSIASLQGELGCTTCQFGSSS